MASHFHALEKEMATHSGVLAWRILGTREPGGLPSMGPHRVGHDWSDLAAAVEVWESEMEKGWDLGGWSSGGGSFLNLWVCAKFFASCLILCDLMDHNPPGSSVHGFLQARILEWVAISFFRGSFQPKDWACISYVSFSCAGRWEPPAPPGKPSFCVSHALMSAFCRDCLECSAPGLHEWVFKGESRDFLAWEGDTGNPCNCVWNSENVQRQLFVKRTIPVMGLLNKSVTCLLLLLKPKKWI